MRTVGMFLGLTLSLMGQTRIIGPVYSTIWGGNHGGSTVSAGSTGYLLVNSTSIGSIEANSQFMVPVSGTLKNFYLNTATTQGGTGALVVTVKTCTPSSGACSGSNTAITFTVAINDTARQYSDIVNTAQVSAGDLISVAAVQAAGNTSAQIKAWSLSLSQPQ